VTAYRRGVYAEKTVAAMLRGDGYEVIESRGSHGVADLAAIKAGQEVLWVQVKAGDARLADDWFNALWRQAEQTRAAAIVADMPRRGMVRLRRITGPHAPRSQNWPMEPFTTDEAADAAEGFLTGDWMRHLDGMAGPQAPATAQAVLRPGHATITCTCGASCTGLPPEVHRWLADHDTSPGHHLHMHDENGAEI
jgi:Holliday junction resolvase